MPSYMINIVIWVFYLSYKIEKLPEHIHILQSGVFSCYQDWCLRNISKDWWRKKHFDRREKDGKMKTIGNQLSSASTSTKSMEYPRAQLDDCFRERNVYFFFFFFFIELCSSTPLPADERRNQLREAPRFRFFFATSCWLYRKVEQARRAFSKAP